MRLQITFFSSTKPPNIDVLPLFLVLYLSLSTYLFIKLYTIFSKSSIPVFLCITKVHMICLIWPFHLDRHFEIYQICHLFYTSSKLPPLRTPKFTPRLPSKLFFTSRWSDTIFHLNPQVRKLRNILNFPFWSFLL